MFIAEIRKCIESDYVHCNFCANHKQIVWQKFDFILCPNIECLVCMKLYMQKMKVIVCH